MIIYRKLTRTYNITQAIELRGGELDQLLKFVNVDDVSKLDDGDWTEIWIGLEDQDEFSDRVFRPYESFYPFGDYEDEVEGYEYKEGTRKENHSE